jgi:sigma-B regulation protein RsbU (phosphoserine phosphatase)
MPVEATITQRHSANRERVRAWCALYPRNWDAWTAALRDVSGDALQLYEADAPTSGSVAPVVIDGETLALLGSDTRNPTVEPWLASIANLVAIALAAETELNTMTDELVDTYDQLTFLYEIARMLSTSVTLADALSMLLQQARHIIGADGGALVIEQSEKPLLVLTDGSVPERAFLLTAHRVVSSSNRPLVANDAAAVSGTVGVAEATGVSSAVVAPIVTPQGAVTASCFGATKLDGFTAGNRKLMQAVAEQSITIAGQFALQEEQIRRSRMARDLELAAQIQTALLPTAFPGAPHVSITATMTPASEVGGDFYTHPDERAEEGAPLALAIGDVAGKGVAAALVTTMCLSAMRAEMRHVRSPALALRAVQGFIADELSRIESFVTCILATYDPAARVLAYANAGHTPILHWSDAEQQLRALPATGLPLGVDIGIEVENATVTLREDDLLLFYTDGVTEAMSPTGAFYGDERLHELLTTHARNAPSHIRDAILEDVRTFAPVQRDDITLIILKAET